jgi:23S rRNA (uridine2552-2'-O)-methyltransferase
LTVAKTDICGYRALSSAGDCAESPDSVGDTACSTNSSRFGFVSVSGDALSAVSSTRYLTFVHPSGYTHERSVVRCVSNPSSSDILKRPVTVPVRVPGKDRYYNRAKQEGYRSRSAYKLRQLDDTADVLPRGGVAVDVGAAPGGWLQVAAERVGPRGRVVGVDRQRIEDVEKTDDRAHVETVRGDVTDETTRDRLLDAVGDGADAVVSDVAPNMTGEYTVDHARSVHLAGVALDVALACLRPGGDFVAKVFDGPDLDRLRDDVDAEFEYVRDVRPDASRESSSELYLVGKGRVTAPVAEGEVRAFDVVDTGAEGDGIARVDGYTVFVDAAEGETVRARVTDVKPNYAFTKRVDGAEE